MIPSLLSYRDAEHIYRLTQGKDFWPCLQQVLESRGIQTQEIAFKVESSIAYKSIGGSALLKLRDLDNTQEPTSFDHKADPFRVVFGAITAAKVPNADLLLTLKQKPDWESHR